MQGKPFIFPQEPKDDRKTITVLTINANDIPSLVSLLELLGQKIDDGEMEGCGIGCKWWIDERKIDD